MLTEQICAIHKTVFNLLGTIIMVYILFAKGGDWVFEIGEYFKGGR